MRTILPKSLLTLAQNCPAPLYVVGGSVRDFLSGFSMQTGDFDWDICAPISTEQFVEAAKKSNFTVQAVYKNTGTVKLCDSEKTDFEFSCFRSDKYVRGIHVPVEICFTTDIMLDAKRRDFTCNAVYYDVSADAYVDPLHGIPAIKEKRLTTVAPAEKVFGEDGLRLMRLARQAAQLGYYPDQNCLQGAQKNAALIQDISPERIFAELSAILTADEKHGVKDGHYQGLKLLDKTGVLTYILPELSVGKNMQQRKDFHKYDVLEHSFRSVLYAEKSIRLAALLHDVGKPFCMHRDGNTYAHAEEGARLADEILRRLKAPKKESEKIVKLISLHMYDLDCKAKESKLRRFFVKHYPLLPELIKLKQADFSACMDDMRVAPTCQKWNALLNVLREENAPLTVKQLAVKGDDLLLLDLPKNRISTLLNALLEHAVLVPKDNEKARLCAIALRLNESF